MICAPRFHGDINEKLMFIQHNFYYDLIRWLFEHPRQRYKEAINLLCVETDLWIQIKDRNGFDHRTLQEPHDKIAAYYRYTHPREIQLALDEMNYEERLTQNWLNYWHNEVRELIKDNIITRTILTAVGYQNTPKGYAAEKLLIALLDERYGSDWETGRSVKSVP